MPYEWAAKRRIFEAIGYAKRIQTKHFGELDYPRPEVEALHRSDARIKVALSPARMSKSYSGAADMCPDILDFERPEKHLIIGPDYDKASKEFGYVVDFLVTRRNEAARVLGVPIPEPSSYQFNVKQGRMSVVWPWGAELHAKSAMHFSTVLGESWGVVLMSETCEIGPEIFYRGLRTRSRRFIMPTTPGLKGIWVKELVDRAVDMGESDVAVFRYGHDANPLYDMDRFRAELARCGPEDPYFREQFMGEWVFYGGRVFPAFNPDPVETIKRQQIRAGGIVGRLGRHCVELDPRHLPAEWARVAGMDFGWQDPTVHLWGAVAPDGLVVIYDEYYEPQRSTREHAIAIKARSEENGTPRIDDCVREPKGQAAQIAQDYASEFGIFARPADNADRLSSRLHLQAYLDVQSSTGMPSVAIVKNRCPNLVRELVGLHYDTQDAPRTEGRAEKWKGDDHAVDAMRYLLSTRPAPKHSRGALEEYQFTIDRMRRKRRQLKRKDGMIGQAAIRRYLSGF